MGFTSKVKSKSTMVQMLSQLRTLDGKEAEAGFDDKMHPEAEVTYAELANFHEYGTINSSGTRHIPIRAFMGQAFHDMMANPSLATESFIKAFYGKSTTNKELKKLAQKLKELIRVSIERADFEELDPFTIRLKGHNTILQESGRLINNIRNDVVKSPKE